MEDAKIIDLYWDRDETAITETDAKYGSYCRAISLRITNSMQDMEECVNDTYLGAWNAMPPQRPTILQAFLGKITRNLSLKKYRENTALKRGGGNIISSLDELEDLIGTDSSIDEKLEADELTAVINGFLKGRKEMERQVFVCRYFYFESIAEIARRFSCGESRIKMMLKRTRDDLRAVLEKEDILV